MFIVMYKNVSGWFTSINEFALMKYYLPELSLSLLKVPALPSSFN